MINFIIFYSFKKKNIFSIYYHTYYINLIVALKMFNISKKFPLTISYK